jgi:cephalosporin hydroxylase
VLRWASQVIQAGVTLACQSEAFSHVCLWARQPIFTLFHRTWFDTRMWSQQTWLGVQILKSPFDLQRYQELLVARRPDFLIEVGAAVGGSTLFFATIFDAIGHGQVISIDIDPRWAKPALKHPRIVTITGSSLDPAIMNRIRALIPPTARAFVVLDSDHSRDHVLAECRLYQAFVLPGDYMVVEDANKNGHPVDPTSGPGPYEAVARFLRETSAFEPDPACEVPFTWAPNGWLRRRA